MVRGRPCWERSGNGSEKWGLATQQCSVRESVFWCSRFSIHSVNNGVSRFHLKSCVGSRCAFLLSEHTPHPCPSLPSSSQGAHSLLAESPASPTAAVLESEMLSNSQSLWAAGPHLHLGVRIDGMPSTFTSLTLSLQGAFGAWVFSPSSKHLCLFYWGNFCFVSCWMLDMCFPDFSYSFNKHFLSASCVLSSILGPGDTAWTTQTHTSLK